MLTSRAASLARYPLGGRVGPLGPRPARRLTLYEFEACPFCRKVREALTMLDLEALILPTPRDGGQFRPEAIARGGRAQFPLLVDDNVTTPLIYESDAIVAHLYARYGAGAPPLALRLGPLTSATSALASALRPGHGRRARRAPGDARRAPAAPLTLWSFEASPAARLVREALCELELPYLLRNAAPGSPSRAALREAAGAEVIPYLVDPNSGARHGEAGAIVAYLGETYGASR